MPCGTNDAPELCDGEQLLLHLAFSFAARLGDTIHTQSLLALESSYCGEEIAIGERRYAVFWCGIETLFLKRLFECPYVIRISAAFRSYNTPQFVLFGHNQCAPMHIAGDPLNVEPGDTVKVNCAPADAGTQQRVRDVSGVVRRRGVEAGARRCRLLRPNGHD